MLSSEEAHRHLEAYRDTHYRENQSRRLSSLPADLFSMGQILVQAGPKWIKIAHDPKQVNMAVEETELRLVKLKVNERQKLFEALFPKLSPQVEATWNLFNHLPYQFLPGRRPFRSPHQDSSGARMTMLQRLIIATRGYDEEVAWFAAWAPYLGLGVPDALGYLFAGAIEAGGSKGQEVLDILMASANGSHETGTMGRHVVRGLLCASRPEGWELIERMLLAAQREEGLRQVILESVDEAHPQAFRRLLRLILDHNLSRFSAAVRAFDVWFGLALETVPQKTVNALLAQVSEYLDDAQKRERAVLHGSAEEAYYALWAMAFEDAQAALPQVIALRQSPSLEHRFAATHLLAQMDLVGSFNELLNALDDPNLQVAARAVMNLRAPEYRHSLLEQSDLFERLERLIARLPHKENTLRPLVWDWLVIQLNRDDLSGRLVECLGSRPPNRLMPHIPNMQPMDRSRAASLLKEVGEKDAQARQVLLTLAGDSSLYVRKVALDALQLYRLAGTEIEQMEELLTRQAEDLRRGVIHLLLTLPDEMLLQSTERLLDKSNESQRRAGLELLRESVQANRRQKECRLLAERYRKSRPVADAEAQILEDILSNEAEVYSLEDALGLMDPGNRTRPSPPRKRLVLFGAAPRAKLGSSAAVEILKSLEALVEQNRTEPIEIVSLDTPKTELLGNIRFGFPNPDPGLGLDQDLARLPSIDTWKNWWQTRSPQLHDPDGFELLRALALVSLFNPRWDHSGGSASEMPAELQEFFGVSCKFKLHYDHIVSSILKWMARIHPCPGEVPFLLDALEESVSRLPESELSGVSEVYGSLRFRILSRRLAYLQVCRLLRGYRAEAWKDEHHARLWAVVRWLDEPKPGIPRNHPLLEDALLAYRSGAATRDDLLDLLMGPREIGSFGSSFPVLGSLSGRKPPACFNEYPDLKALVDDCRERILAIEIRRGDLPTAATRPAMCLRYVPGAKNLLRLLTALGDTALDRSPAGHGRQAVLSRLIRVTFPLPEDGQDTFNELTYTHRISERRLVELAVFAPQWAQLVESRLGWPKFCEAVFWVYAHTKDRDWTVDKEIREQWISQVSEYTPLSTDSLMDGAVDVAWFHQVYEALGASCWKEVYRAAELTAIGSGHMRARIFADAMLGKTTTEALIKRVATKRHQDSLRALGLVPLPADESRQGEILHRYEIIQEFLRTSKKFGSQRQASERLAVAISMENLARTAGYADPQRLEWAMEVESVADLADGPVTVQVSETSVSLSIDDLGQPELAVTRNGKALKSLPAALKNDEHISGLLERKQMLERQSSRMRQSLEAAMCRGDHFTGAEVGFLFRHPILRCMLEQLVLIHKSGMGYPVEGGKALYSYSGRMIPVAPEDSLRIAHPLDLLGAGEWHLWQHECFVAERIQPFKQVYRELYLLTSAEKVGKTVSRRYAGQQVNPRQALSLFGARGWVTNPEEGVHKTFHEIGISARVGFLQGAFTPAEVEGLTLETVVFSRRGEWTPVLLEQVPPRVFSEVMRDLDLVVSVAHAGGVDPEASASSIEARSALILESCMLLGLQNVEVKQTHALVSGKLGNYTVHLGSAVVHKQPGGALCIVPVHAQHRGRLFLPFVDNDPKTAEIISKVILLAKDHEIKDPTILEQII